MYVIILSLIVLLLGTDFAEDTESAVKFFLYCSLFGFYICALVLFGTDFAEDTESTVSFFNVSFSKDLSFVLCGDSEI